MGMSSGSGGGRGRRSRQGNFTDINVTPMVDVMLVLLIIFMVAAPMMTAGVTVDLPDAKSTPVAGQDEPLSVSIKNNGDLYLQNTPIKLEELQAKLIAVAGEKKDTRIFVRGDRNVDYGAVMKAVGEINAAGFTKVSLITDNSGGSSDQKRK